MRRRTAGTSGSGGGGCRRRTADSSSWGSGSGSGGGGSSRRSIGRCVHGSARRCCGALDVITVGESHVPPPPLLLGGIQTVRNGKARLNGC